MAHAGEYHVAQGCILHPSGGCCCSRRVAVCCVQMQLQDRMLDMAPSALTKTEATAQLVQVQRRL
jgi:hypothetical protein